MRIGVLVRNLEEKGGIAVYTRELLRHLIDLDHDNEYYLFYGVPESVGTFGDAPNVHEIVIPCRSKLYWDQVQVARRARRLGLDLVFGPKMSAPFFFPGKKVLTMHGGEQFFFTSEFSLADRVYVRVFLPLYARAADRVIAVSETARQDLARLLRVRPDKFAVAYHGSKKVFSAPLPPDYVKEIRAKHGLEGDFVLHVGLIWGAKNYGIFPGVMDLVNRTRPMVLAHAGKVERWGEEKGSNPRGAHMVELGFVPDRELAALYQSAVAFVFPSLYEGFGIPLVEAMSAGCPVITTGWGAMREVTDGAALYVDARQPQEIADAILALAADEARRAELRKKGIERAAIFDWDETARRTLEVFREVVGGPAAAG
jgi:glycosyltransferase involved in cell wall biosynthesis